MSNKRSKTLRLHVPQWQGGNNHAYHFGAELLAWLSPKTDDPVEVVPVDFSEDSILEDEQGIFGRTQILRQISRSRELIEKHAPDNLVILGGDCLVDLAPFAYLSEKYQDDFGILWIDAHPDIMTPQQFYHAHAMVLAALMGEGDTDLTSFVNLPIKPNKVMYAGVNDESEYEAEFIQKKAIRVSRPEEIKTNLTSIREWIKAEDIKYLAIHLDLDVLSTSNFGSLLFTNPNVPPDAYDGIAQGKLSIAEVLKVIEQAALNADVVGIGITEHLPWDTLNLKKMLSKLPLLSK